MSAAKRSGHATATVLGLWMVLLCVVGAGDTSGWQSRGSVTVLASWTRDEGEAFRALLDTFTRRTGIHVDYQGTTALREVLSSEVASGTPPDIAVLPSTGELAAYARQRQLTPLDGVIPSRERTAYGKLWKPRLSAKGPVYGIAVKADLKSIVWYDRDRRPSTLPALAADGRQWCVGMGDDAASGWPGTDWIEDLLLQQQGRSVYQDWATGGLPWTDPRVERAWQSWGSLFGKDTARTALITDFREAGTKLFGTDPPCALEHQGSFIRGGYPDPAKVTFAFSPGLLPDTDQRSTAREVSGDFAAMFRDTPQAQELMRYLISADAQRAWGEKTADSSTHPFFANRDVQLDAQGHDAVGRSIAKTLRDSTSLCLDASDAMPTRMRVAFQRAALAYLSDTSKPPDGLLRSLERIRQSLRDTPDQPWLSTVCG
ncbi:carbohydrate ABC transporter substrate-binding protein [Streptomyces sp. 110]|uniref:Carbohydrate ABC transporter substrate-binding protein n=1 Tax=Streptomyces endocoffeicus TaxID=2898945 RepID=A0ABS1PNT2_9ACTN|nr:ABC transporter substrate-binding protein [Streptomyces endocoffeicus]MBL1113939.1 carbohydrate ABC transporter substrate-binding protein [Streptomyces endocoffeicus]